MVLVAGGKPTAYYRAPGAPTPAAEPPVVSVPPAAALAAAVNAATAPSTSGGGVSAAATTGRALSRTHSTISAGAGVLTQRVSSAGGGGAPGQAGSIAGGSHSGRCCSHVGPYPDLTSLSLLCTVAPPVVSSPSPTTAAVPTGGVSTAPLAIGGSQYTEVVLQGTALDAPGAELVLRCRGAQIRAPLSPDPSGTTATASVSLASLLSTAPAVGPAGGSTCSIVWAEVVRGAWLSPARALLVVDDPMLAEEVGWSGKATSR
jgi:hypothetical protein